MNPEDTAVVVHMLLAQREQINAILRLLSKDAAPPQSDQPEAKPRWLGDEGNG